MDGSDVTGGCPQACVQIMSTSTYCDCTRTIGAGTFTGVISLIVWYQLHNSERDLGNSTAHCEGLFTEQDSNSRIQLCYVRWNCICSTVLLGTLVDLQLE